MFCGDVKATPMGSCFKKVELLGVNISVVGIRELLEFIVQRASAGHVALINNVNIQAMNVAESDQEFRNILNQSDVVFCDGFGVKAGAFLLGTKLGERMTPPDWIDRLLEKCVEHSLSVYALGDTLEEVNAFVRKVRGKFPSLKLVGHHHGFFDMHGEENKEVIAEISACGADIVLVGMGMPRQEVWAFNARERLPKGVLIAAGALYRWYTGSQRRSPKWMTDHGLEWVGRLFLEPGRMWRRYIVGNPAFFWRVLGRKMCAMKPFLPHLTVLFLLAACAMVLMHMREATVAVEPDLVLSLPDVVGPWSGEPIFFCQNEACMHSFRAGQLTGVSLCPDCGGALREAWSLAESRLLPADTILLKKAYTDPSGQTLNVSVVISGRERVSIHRPQMCLVGQGFAIRSERRSALNLSGRNPLELSVLSLQVPGQPSRHDIPFFYAYWFVGCGKETSSHWARTWYVARDRLLHNRACRWSYIAVSGVGTREGPALTAGAAQFIKLFYPMVLKPREAS